MAEINLNLRKPTALCACLLGVILPCLYQCGIGVHTDGASCVSDMDEFLDNSIETEASLMQVNFLSHLMSKRRAPMQPMRTIDAVNGIARDTAIATANDTAIVTAIDMARRKFDQSLRKKATEPSPSPSPSPTSHLPGPRPVGSTGPQFVIISLAELGKIVYTEVDKGASIEGLTHSLVENLINPKGIAIDNYDRRLYIADTGLKTIYSVGLQVTGYGTLYANSRITLVENAEVDSMTLDDMGNLYYTDSAHGINMMTIQLIREILSGSHMASDLQIVPVEDAMTWASKHNLSVAQYATSSAPFIYTLFGSSNAHVSDPGGIGVSGYNLYWTNKRNGSTAGTVVHGKIDLSAASASRKLVDVFSSWPLEADADSAYGLAATPDFVFWSTSTHIANDGVIHMEMPGFGGALEVVQSVSKPRGIVWDGDGTIYWADPIMGSVYSFPSGRLMANAPLTTTVLVQGAWGVTFLSIY